MTEPRWNEDAAQRPAWVPEGIDWRKPSVARVYDVHLGGAHNFAVDREVAEELARVLPELPELFRANRSFLRRAVRFLIAKGITQLLDLGSGIPTVGNVHEVAQQANPDARVAYVDIDPVAAAHGRHLLASNPKAVAVHGDLRQPEEILGTEAVRNLLDESQPVGVLLVAALNFVSDADDPAGIVARYLDRLAPGSYLVISHPTFGEHEPQRLHEVAGFYSRTVDNISVRQPEQIASWFTGLELVDPGLVYINAWRPDDPSDAWQAERLPQLGGVGRKT